MPYYITDQNPNCSGWAVMAEGDAEKIFGCHATKQDAIDQAVAVSLADDELFIGERAEGGPEIGVSDIDGTLLTGGNLNEMAWAYIRAEGYPLFIVTGRPESQRDDTISELRDAGVEFADLIMNPGSTADSPEYKKETMTQLLETYDVKYALENDETTARYYRELGVETYLPSEIPSPSMDDEEDRAVDLSAPAFMREAAAKGLEWYRAGLGGAGLVARTIRDAEAMAEGRVSADKWVRIAAWVARHLTDLDAPAADPESEDYPSPGVVAHALWGSIGGKSGAERTKNYAEDIVAKIEAEKEMSRSVSNIETRVEFRDFEVRETSDGMTLTGYAARFNEPSEPLPFVERIAPGAFKRSLRSKNDIKLLWNHDSSMVLGSTRAKTLSLFEDERGLRVEAMLPDTSAGRDAKVLIQRGDVTGFSFGFTVPKGGDSWNSDGTERTLKSVRLHEVSVGVAFPAYPSTNGTAQVRSLDKLATRAEVDADALAVAFDKLEAGDDITADERDLLATVIDKLAPQDVEELNADLLALKKKKLEILKTLSS